MERGEEVCRLLQGWRFEMGMRWNEKLEGYGESCIGTSEGKGEQAIGLRRLLLLRRRRRRRKRRIITKSRSPNTGGVTILELNPGWNAIQKKDFKL
jgi:hypothetical protein